MARYSDSIPNTSWKNVSEPVSSRGFNGSPDVEEEQDGGNVFKKDVDWGNVFGKLFDIADKNKYRSMGEDRSDFERKWASSGGSNFGSASSQRVTENASVYNPPQMQPYTVSGVQGKPGILSQVAGVAAPVVGMMGGPTAPFISAGLGGLSRTGW